MQASSKLARPALQDASNRVNQPSALPPQGKKAAGQSTAGPVQPAAKAAASKKRKSESLLEDEIAAYKQDLDYIDTDGWPIDMTCGQVRGKINKLLDSGIMKKGEFCKATNSTSKSLNTFLSRRGTMDGANTAAYGNAWSFFKQREIAGLKMPDVKKRQKTEAAAAASASSNAEAGPSSAGKAAARKAPGPDINSVELRGEETDSVSVYDTCDEVRKKINAHLRTPGLTASQFCRDLYAQLRHPTSKCFQTKQLSDFRGKKGPRAGCTSRLFYAAYVFFEKKRIAEGKPKSQHRLNMEDLWAWHGGFDLEHDGRHGVIVSANRTPYMDQYGTISSY
ncbi:hypothetical protein F4779DRAFT_562154 [Xylariaceae sp. FL0662B]|nr:hypothetical protein F4779DRAFT_562154 [Xylariaceae sp. FL0662B]